MLVPHVHGMHAINSTRNVDGLYFSVSSLVMLDCMLCKL